MSFLAGFLVFSSLHIVIGEQVPKTLAIRQPMPVSQWIAYPLHVSYLVFWPLNWLLNSASRGILRMLGVKESSQHEILTNSEIEGLVEESAVHGGIESGEAEYIHNVFRFGDLAVSDVMVHRTAMVMINADLPPDELVREVLATEYTRIPLWRDKPENIIGVLHAKDLLRAIRASEGDTSRINVTAIMLPPWFVPEMRPLSEQLKAFRRRKTHFALVVDEYGEVEGMVTLEDILEEIVGDISDEHDVVVAGVRAQPDGSVVVDGSVPIRDLNRAMNWHLPDEEATTVAGLVIHEARSIPERGQSFTFHGFRFRVLRRERNRITALQDRAGAARRRGRGSEAEAGRDGVLSVGYTIRYRWLTPLSFHWPSDGMKPSWYFTFLGVVSKWPFRRSTPLSSIFASSSGTTGLGHDRVEHGVLLDQVLEDGPQLFGRKLIAERF